MNPIFIVNGEPLVLVTQYLGAVRASTLGAATASLKSQGDEINAALDMLFYGF